MLTIDLKQAFTMPATAPAYPPPPFHYENCHWVTVFFQTDPAVIQSLVPEPLVPDSNPILGIYLARLSVVAPLAGTYHEAGLVANVSFNGKPGMYFSNLYLDSALGVVLGREIWGFPKKPAQINYEENDGQISADVSLLDVPLIKLSMHQARNLDQLPDDPIQAGFTLKIIPSARRGSPPDVLQLISIPHNVLIHEIYEGPGTLELLSHPYDPLGKIPVLKVIGATFYVMDMTLDWGEVVVNCLKEDVEQREPVLLP